METIAPLAPLHLGRTARFLFCAAILLSGFFLIAWVVGSVDLRPFLGSSMKPNTSLGCVLASLALLLHEISEGRSWSRTARAIAVFLGFVVFAIGFATLCEYWFEVNLGIDELLAADFLSEESMLFPGRMSPNAAVGLVLAGIAVVFLHLPGAFAMRMHQAILLLLGLICLFALIGYLLGVSALYKVGPFIRISPFTATALLAIATGNLFLRPQVGFMRTITSHTPGGMAIRRMLPAAIFLPPVIGFLRLAGQTAGFYETAQGTSLSVITYIVLFSTMIYWSGKQLNRVARDRFEVEQRYLAEANTRANELQAALRIRDEFLSVASHELKTPLTSLKLQVQMQKRAFQKDMSQQISNERLVQFLENGERQINRVARLIEDMLDVGRIHSGRFTLNTEEFDLVELVREICEQMEAEFATAGSRLALNLPDKLLGRWDRIRIGQVLANLFSNAAKYGAGKPVDILVEQVGETVTLTVTDRGLGIDPTNHQRIFERFERAVPGTHISGMGLGLFIVKQILELHGGKIRVESAVGQGAKFVVDLPLRTA